MRLEIEDITLALAIGVLILLAHVACGRCTKDLLDPLAGVIVCKLRVGAAKRHQFLKQIILFPIFPSIHGAPFLKVHAF